MKKIFTIIAAALIVSVSACSSTGTETTTTLTDGTRQESVVTSASTTTETTTVSETAPPVPDADIFSGFDTNPTYSSLSATITLEGASAVVDGSGAAFADGDIVITAGGAYLLTGSLDDGTVIVEVSSDEKVQLVLDNASVVCADGPAVYVKNADKVLITLEDGSVNTFSDGTTYASDEANACVYSKDDLTINGGGSLTVKGGFNNGISTSNDLKIVSGDITVNAVNNAVKGKDSVSIGGGSVTVISDDDGIKCDNDTETGEGTFFMGGGTLSITAADDGITAITSITVTGGKISFSVGDKTTNCDGVVSIADGCVV